MSAFRRFSERSLGSRRSEDGVSSLIGLLAVVMILGILAYIAMSSSPTAVISLGSQPTSPGTAVPGSPASGASQAETSVCKTDFLALTLAVDNYRAINGALPPSGTSWATSASAGSPMIQSWPKMGGFSFTWNGSSLTVEPTKGTPSVGSFGTSSPPTGCFAN